MSTARFASRNLDLLRALAVLFVLFAHTTEVMSFGSEALRAAIDMNLGRFGVMLFFVHTALVLMMSIERNSATPLWPFRFYLQRIFRIYPLSILCVATVLLFRIPPMLPGNFSWPSTANILANLTLTQNFSRPQPFLFRGLMVANNSLSGPMWSLPFEMQMYLVLPAVFWFVRKHGEARSWLLASASVVLAITEKSLSPTGAWLTEFFPCFMGGVLAFSMLRRPARLSSFLWPLWLFLLAGFFFVFGNSPILKWGLCLLLGATLSSFQEIPLGWASKVSAIIARYSYGIYLSHMPLRWFCFDRLHAATWLSWSLYLTLIPAASFALYHAVEAPMIRTGKRLSLRLAMDRIYATKAYDLPPSPAEGDATMI